MSKKRRRHQRGKGARTQNVAPISGAPSAPISWRGCVKRYSGDLIHGAAFALAIGPVTAALSVGGDVTYVVVFLSVGWAVAAISLATYERLGVRARLETISAVAFAFVGLGLFAIHHARYRENQLTDEKVLFDAQFKELTALEDFIGAKDESELRELFGFPDAVKFNVMIAKRNFLPNGVTRRQSEAIDNFLATGTQAKINTESMTWWKSKGGGISAQMKPGEIGEVYLPKQYGDKRAVLTTLNLGLRFLRLSMPLYWNLTKPSTAMRTCCSA